MITPVHSCSLFTADVQASVETSPVFSLQWNVLSWFFLLFFYDRQQSLGGNGKAATSLATSVCVLTYMKFPATQQEDQHLHTEIHLYLMVMLPCDRSSSLCYVHKYKTYGDLLQCSTELI